MDFSTLDDALSNDLIRINSDLSEGGADSIRVQVLGSCLRRNCPDSVL